MLECCQGSKLMPSPFTLRQVAGQRPEATKGRKRVARVKLEAQAKIDRQASIQSFLEGVKENFPAKRLRQDV